MNRNAQEILDVVASRHPSFLEKFHEYVIDSSEVIFFGSYAYGCENAQSDVDVLLVGEGKRRADKCFDFVWLKPNKLQSNTWLCSELANHVANYGVWYKGEGLWRKEIFFCEAAITRKKQGIYNRLIQLHLKRKKLSKSAKRNLLEKIILNSYRIIYLQNKVPNPPTYVTVKRLVQNEREFINKIFSEQILGRLGEVLFLEIFNEQNVFFIIEKTIEQLSDKYIKTSII